MQFWSVFMAALLISASTVRAGVLARFKMNNDLGTIDVELFEHDKPATVNNFIAYVKSGAWHDTQVQRWQASFVIQGGNYFMQHRDDLKTPLAAGNRVPVQSLGNIPFEMNAGRFFSNGFGTLAMARGSDTNSASTDWFFNLADNTSLDTAGGGYVVFGRTVQGTNILNYFNPPFPSGKLYTVNDASLPPDSYLPAYSLDGVNAFFVNMDITLLTTRISLVRGFPQISWDSVAGRPNIVEFSDTFPPTWQTFQTVTGSGATMSITDNAGSALIRYYRVRVDYGP